MIHKTGDLFTTDADILAHGVNCKGVMGAGIAKMFRSKYPLTYVKYVDHCNEGTLLPGDFFAHYEIPSDKLIVNLASQNEPGPDAQYHWLAGSVMKFANQMDEYRVGLYGNKIAIPEIGCGIGGLIWDDVQRILETVEYIYPTIEFEVWHYAG